MTAASVAEQLRLMFCDAFGRRRLSSYRTAIDQLAAFVPRDETPLLVARAAIGTGGLQLGLLVATSQRLLYLPPKTVAPAARAFVVTEIPYDSILARHPGLSAFGGRWSGGKLEVDSVIGRFRFDKIDPRSAVFELVELIDNSQG